MTDHVHEWVVGVKHDTYAPYAFCRETDAELDQHDIEAMLNEHAKLKRVRDAAKNQRDMLRKTKHFGDLTEIERELFDALADTQESE